MINKIFVILILSLVRIAAFAQEQIDFENKALTVFNQKRNYFSLKKTDIVYYQDTAERSLRAIDFNYHSSIWGMDSVVRKNAYNSNDSLLNSKRKDFYLLTGDSSTINLHPYKKWKSKPFHLSVFKRFYYDNSVYVYMEFYERKNFMIRTMLAKYDYAGNFIGASFLTMTP